MCNQTLFTDLYELTMAQAYQAEGMDQIAVFELAFREMPENRNYIVAAGFQDVLDFLTGFHFSTEELGFLRGIGSFSEAFLKGLERLRFTGNVYAVPEGTLAFPNEPLLQVIAPITEAQLIETFVLNQIHFQSIAATKAARVVAAARGRAVIDFGSRRSHGTDAALKVTRATYLAGGDGTSNVLAGKIYGIPMFGTMAHSYIQAHDDESTSFDFPQETSTRRPRSLSIPRTLAGVRKVIDLSRNSATSFACGPCDSIPVIWVVWLSQTRSRCWMRRASKRLTIFVSSSLDESQIQDLVNSGRPIDAFGVGTKLAVMEGASHLDMAYKLVEYGGKGRLKLSTKKELYPGRKQVFRQVEAGHMVHDVIGRFDEPLTGEPLLKPLLLSGQPVSRIELAESRRCLRSELKRLPDHLHSLQSAPTPYPVHFSEQLKVDLNAIRRELGFGNT